MNQVWCTKEQERIVEEVMTRLFDKVERHLWWKVPSDSKEVYKIVQFVEPDFLVGFIGYFHKQANELLNYNTRQRSRVVIAAAPKDGGVSGQVAKEFIEAHTKQGDFIADLMSRNGNVAVGAAATGRNSFSMDILHMRVGIFLLVSHKEHGTKWHVCCGC
jgi:hypothetical protein